MTSNLVIRAMSRSEADELVALAANEGWNPGHNDADLFWANDPEAFIAAELDGTFVGGGTITSYGGDYGFMGFFIVRPEWRGRGLGNQLWLARRDRLLARLKPGAAIGMDGVFDMQAYYAKGGFVFSHRNLRFELPAGSAVEARATPGLLLVPATEVPFDALLAYDRSCFPAERRAFLGAWIAQDGATALACLRNGELAGFGVSRPCLSGTKIGPLFAHDAGIAEALFSHLAASGGEGPVYLDVPEPHGEAMALAARHGMREVFGCARMYLGPRPKVDESRIYGITTFELG